MSLSYFLQFLSITIEPSAAIKLYSGGAVSRESVKELNCRNTISRGSSLSLARCWLRAEAVGVCGSMSKKSNSSFFELEAH